MTVLNSLSVVANILAPGETQKGANLVKAHSPNSSFLIPPFVRRGLCFGNNRQTLWNEDRAPGRDDFDRIRRDGTTHRAGSD